MELDIGGIVTGIYELSLIMKKQISILITFFICSISFGYVNEKLNDKIDWSWRCRYLESQLINFAEAYGNYETKIKKTKDTLYLESNYFYNEPGVIDEEYSRKIVVKIHSLDSVKHNKVYEINNPLFQVETSTFSVWDWSEKKNPELRGYIVFREVSNRRIVAYLNIDLIENSESRKIIDKLLEYKK